MSFLFQIYVEKNLCGENLCGEKMTNMRSGRFEVRPRDKCDSFLSLSLVFVFVSLPSPVESLH